ncbi:MAG: glycosyltransferase family 2 protein [Actinobacteria bacterium]|nr:glycosyltransferase family 2 protein [Actinomycetota bacterium]
MKLSIIIPAYNERNTIKEILRRVRAVDLGEIEKEIIVVDDGSTDGTGDILKLEEDSTTRVIRHDVNRGKGAAIRDALPQATGDYIIIQDADLEYDPEDFRIMLAPVLKKKADVVYGSRFTGEHRDMLYWHWLGNKFLNFVTNVLYNTTLSDMETCYKLFSRDSLKGIEIESEGFEVEPEITAKLLRKKVRIYEVPVSYAGREYDEGKKIVWMDGFKALWSLIKYRFVR